MNTPKSQAKIMPFPSPIEADAVELIDYGLDIIPLAPREKGCFTEGWSAAEPHTVESFRAAAQPGGNIGMRLGRKVEGGFVHTLDVDVDKDGADPARASAEAIAAARKLAPEIATGPSAISGSGLGRHYQIVTSEPFEKFVPVSGDGWKIEFLGFGQQVVVPPSIHPSGNAYRWERKPDLTLLGLGVGVFPVIPAERVRAWGGRVHGEKDAPPVPVLSSVSDWQRRWVLGVAPV